jgi:hypothetical protein
MKPFGSFFTISFRFDVIGVLVVYAETSEETNFCTNGPMDQWTRSLSKGALQSRICVKTKMLPRSGVALNRLYKPNPGQDICRWRGQTNWQITVEKVMCVPTLPPHQRHASCDQVSRRSPSFHCTWSIKAACGWVRASEPLSLLVFVFF